MTLGAVQPREAPPAIRAAEEAPGIGPRQLALHRVRIQIGQEDAAPVRDDELVVTLKGREIRGCAVEKRELDITESRPARRGRRRGRGGGPIRSERACASRQPEPECPGQREKGCAAPIELHGRSPSLWRAACLW